VSEIEVGDMLMAWFGSPGHPLRAAPRAAMAKSERIEIGEHRQRTQVIGEHAPGIAALHDALGLIAEALPKRCLVDQQDGDRRQSTREPPLVLGLRRGGCQIEQCHRQRGAGPQRATPAGIVFGADTTYEK